ncbi:MAG: biotin attachment protein [Deltaproteobacteria bacterium]|nr:biotin attachment protein [Deltaproteobacteria bacterium]
MTLIDVLAPELGREVETMLLVGWRASPGSPVEAGEPLFEVETDKAVFEVEAEAGGILSEILVTAGEPVCPGAVVGRIRVG